jgi:anti-sigma regulatory factor (Ser/Thr protein kinase)
MDNQIFSRYAVEDRSYTAFIKREIHNSISKHGFNESRIGVVDIIISELTSNLLKHAKGGELFSRIIFENNIPTLEIICLDEGAGIADVRHVIKDGVSTAKTLGHGLGAIQRLSDFFQIYSLSNWGTIIYSKVQANKAPSHGGRKKVIEIKALCVPKPGYEVSGDGCFVKNFLHETHIFFGDGLGHGIEASKVIGLAIESFRNCHENEPFEILRCMHNDTRRTRGLVGTVAVLNHKTRQWKICGVGNIMTRIYSGLLQKNFRPYNGIIGLNIPNSLSNHIYEAENNQYLVMCSDGIRSRWDFTKYSTLFKYDMMMIASMIYKDFTRRNDDSTIMIGKVTFDK